MNVTYYVFCYISSFCLLMLFGIKRIMICHVKQIKTNLTSKGEFDKYMNNLLLKKDLSAEQLAMINGEMNNKQKSKGIAYALWFFLGGFGAHRFYVGHTGYAIGMLLTFGGLGVWTLIDAFLIGKAIEAKNETVEKDIIMNVKSFA